MIRPWAAQTATEYPDPPHDIDGPRFGEDRRDLDPARMKAAVTSLRKAVEMDARASSLVSDIWYCETHDQGPGIGVEARGNPANFDPLRNEVGELVTRLLEREGFSDIFRHPATDRDFLFGMICVVRPS
jgi:hypothetical protein